MTTCRIRVTRDTPLSGALEWATGGRHGEAHASGSGSLTSPPVTGPCELVLASDLVLLGRVAAAPSQQRRLGTALRYLAEELALPDPERLHVASAPGPERNALCLGIVDRQWLSDLLEKLRAAGLDAVAAYPESLLPTLLPHTWTVVWQDGGGFVRTGESEAVTLDATGRQDTPRSLRLALEQARGAGTRPNALVVRCGRGAAPPDLEAWSETLGIPVEQGPDWHWGDSQPRPALELLQGEFAARGGAAPWLQRLRRAAVMAAVLLALASAALALDWNAKVRERNALLGEMRSVYRETFGAQATVVDAPLQMRRALADLRHRAGHVGAGDFLALVEIAAGLLPQSARQHVEGLSYDGATLTLTLQPPAQQGAALLNALRARTPPPGYAIAPEAPAGGGIVLRVRYRHGS